jgi:hypothetical protein
LETKFVLVPLGKLLEEGRQSMLVGGLASLFHCESRFLTAIGESRSVMLDGRTLEFSPIFARSKTIIHLMLILKNMVLKALFIRPVSPHLDVIIRSGIW